jgi:exopolysaccharide biosynthesis polyprenyl glycosylphosphotransferase
MLKSITLIDNLKKLETRYHLDLKWLLNIVEFITVILIIPLSFAITRFSVVTGDSWSLNLYQFGIYTFFFIFLWFVLSQTTSMAMLPRAQRYISAILLFFRGYFLIFLSLVLLKYTFNMTDIPLMLIIIHVHLSFLITLGLRLLTIHFLRIYRINGYNLRNIVIIGDSCSYQIIDKLHNQKDWGFNIRAIITRSAFIKNKYGDEIPIIPDSNNLSYILESQVVDEIFYVKKQIEKSEIRKIARLSNEIGVVFRVQSNVSTLAPEEVQLKTLNEAGKLTLVDIPSRKLAHDVKTVTDIVFSSIALILLSPFLLIIAMLVKSTSDGPVFFAQERVGLRGRKFKLYKFRSMKVNAEKELEKLMAQNEMDGPTFKLKDDPRITSIGKFLRKTGLDELPQLYNVVKGEMSLIGPRPPIESEVKQYERWQLRRLSVKPGITCTWQIMPHRNDIKFENWMKMDLHYIDNWTLLKDIKLIFKTISTMIFATGR